MSLQSHNKKLILASTSRYRKTLLERFGIEFDTRSPNTDETPGPGEKPDRLVSRLARDKAMSVARQNPEAVVIGSDQVAVHDGRIVGKPGNFEAAARQLEQFSGSTVHFLTAVSVVCAATGDEMNETADSEVRFRTLDTETIARYLALDEPFDCAGAFKSELAGSSLLEYLRSDDPTAIIGLPLIAVSRMLRGIGFQVP